MKCLQPGVGLEMRMTMGKGIQMGRGGAFQGSTLPLVVWHVVLWHWVSGADPYTDPRKYIQESAEPIKPSQCPYWVSGT